MIRNFIYFTGENIISKQHGLLHGKSSLSDILEWIDIINEYLMEGDYADIIYLDFSMAFDTLPQNRLRVKMKNSGFF